MSQNNSEFLQRRTHAVVDVTNLDAFTVEVSSLLLTKHEITLQTVNDLTLVAKVIMTRGFHFRRTQLANLQHIKK